MINFTFRNDVSLENSIDVVLETHAKHLQLQFKKGDIHNLLENILRSYCAKERAPYILVDEYDLPIYHKDEEIAEENLQTLKSFLTTLKNCQAYTKRQCLTGITKPDYLGLASGGNHLRDLTYYHRYATLFGFTEQEIKRYFGEHLKNLEGLWGVNHEAVWNRLKEFIMGIIFQLSVLHLSITLMK